MDEKIQETIIEIIKELGYGKSDEELNKYLYEKGLKAYNLVKENNYDINTFKKIINDNIKNTISEYNRLTTNIKEKYQEKDTMFGTSICYQLIDIFDIEELSSTEEEFNTKKQEYLSSIDNNKIFPGIEELTLSQTKLIYENIINNIDTITPEAEAKMTLIINPNEPLYKDNKINEKIFNFKYLDRIFDFANKNNKNVRLHTIVWHQHFPEILKDASKEQIIEFLDTYMKKVKERYGDFQNIDVLNEIVSDIKDPNFEKNQLRNSHWKEKLGDEYYLEVLKLARKNFPKSQLVYNEYDETNPKKRKYIIDIVNKIKQEEEKLGIKLLDAIGLQSHYHQYTSDEEIKTTYSELSKTGKNLQITELDIDTLNSKKEIEVNRVLRTVLDCAATYGVKILNMWGINNKISWKHNHVSTFLDESGKIDSNTQKLVSTYSKNYKERTIKYTE